MIKNKYQPKPINEIAFGKYKGKTFEHLMDVDPSYLEWMLNNTDPADIKNGGRYAKQNQERIAYIKNLLKDELEEEVQFEPGKDEYGADEEVPFPTEEKPVKQSLNADNVMNEQILKILLKLEENSEIIIKKLDENKNVI